MTSDEKFWLKVTAGGLIVIYVGKPLLEFIGLIPSKQDLEGLSNPAYNPDPTKPLPNKTLSRGQADQIATEIWESGDSFGFNQFDYVLAAFKKLKTKDDVKQVAQSFLDNFKLDMYQYLRDGGGIFFWDGLSERELNQINIYVNSLP